MIDNKYNLRLIDYGFTVPIPGYELINKVGSLGYLAPEMSSRNV